MRRAAVYLFVVVAFVTLAWRNEVQDDKVNALIYREHVAVYDFCVGRQANVARTNAYYRGLIAIDEEFKVSGLPPATVRTLDHRIALLNAAILTQPDCGSRP